jgi:hypothetical protein
MRASGERRGLTTIYAGAGAASVLVEAEAGDYD